MNNARRKSIKTLKSRIEAILVEINDIHDNLEIVLDEEQDAFDNMPENLQYSERGENSSNAIDSLTEAISNLEEAISNLEEIY